MIFAFLQVLKYNDRWWQNSSCTT